MGSSSSGNHGCKRTTNDMRALDVRKFQREVLLKSERSISLTWSQNGKPEATIDMQVRSELVRTQVRTPTRACARQVRTWRIVETAAVKGAVVCHTFGHT